LYYLCDRASLPQSSLQETQNRLLLPQEGIQDGSPKDAASLFEFKPGQYAYYVSVSSIRLWHPFSIASGPDSPFIEFYIEVFEQSWTGKLVAADQRQSRRRGEQGSAASTLTSWVHMARAWSGRKILVTPSLFGTGTGK
jgi:hypothetical protein